MTELFNVALFFPDGSRVYERERIEAEAAVRLAKECTQRPAVTLGVIHRIMIELVDDGTTAFLWEAGKGVVFPLRGQTASL